MEKKRFSVLKTDLGCRLLREKLQMKMNESRMRRVAADWDAADVQRERGLLIRALLAAPGSFRLFWLQQVLN